MGLSEALDTKEADQEKLLQESKSLREELDEVKEKFATSKKDAGQMSDEIEAQKREMSGVQKEKADLEVLLQTSQEKAEELRSEKEKLKVDSLEKAAKVEDLTRMVEDKDKECSRAQHQLESKEADIQRFFQEKEELLAKIEAGEGVNTAIDQLKAENSILNEKLEAEIKQSEKRELESSAIIDSLNQQLGSQKKDLMKEKHENEERMKEVADKEREANDLKKKLTEAEEELKETKAKAEGDQAKSRDKLNDMEESLTSI